MTYLDNGNDKGFGLKGFFGFIDRTKFNLNSENTYFGSDSYKWTFRNGSFSFGGFYFYKINSIFIQPYGMVQLAIYNLDVSDSDAPGGSVMNYGIDVGVDFHIIINSSLGLFTSIGYNLYLINEATFDIETNVKYEDDPWIWANHEANLKSNFFRVVFGATWELD